MLEKPGYNSSSRLSQVYEGTHAVERMYATQVGPIACALKLSLLCRKFKGCRFYDFARNLRVIVYILANYTLEKPLKSSSQLHMGFFSGTTN